MEEAITQAIEERISRAQRDGDLASVTPRVVKEHIKAEMGETAFGEIMADQHLKMFVKDETLRLFHLFHEEEPSVQSCGVGRGGAAKPEGEREKQKQKQKVSSDEHDEHEEREKKKKKKKQAAKEASSDEDDFQAAKPSKKGRARAVAVSDSDDGDDFVAVTERKAGGGKRKSVDAEDDDGDDFDHPKKKKASPRGSADENTRPRDHRDKADKDRNEKKHRKDKEQKPQKKATAQPPSEEVLRLKELAKKCGLLIAPNVYRGNPTNEELEERLGAFLLSSGLKSLHPKQGDISKLKAERTLAAELDGIDTSNIVTGRRKSGAPLAPRPAYDNWGSDSDC